jgi:2-polyprenyl-3-methyl-5-hydroxy-6-metoxy-1,4-benzoquinol methylase
MNNHAGEVNDGERFEFGANWMQFLARLNDDRIEIAKRSLKNMLAVESLEGKRFLDAGSGSGLFSLAARLLGARVHSFDYDPQSVACTAELKRRYFPEDAQWVVEEGSVLGRQYLSRLGAFDVVYSWGVLHHTGKMWEAMGNIAPLVGENAGRLFISIYNDQLGWSRRWHALKRTYNRLPRVLRLPYALLVMGPRELRSLAGATVAGKPRRYFDNIFHYANRSTRGMSYWHDVLDWIGGYPFEVAKPEQVFDFYRTRGFTLERLKTCGGGLGCNEYVFLRNA